MKVLLSHAYFLEEDPKERVIMKPYPTLGILYISAYLNEKGVDHNVFDTTFSTREKLYNKLLENQPDLLALYTNLMTKVRVVEVMNWVKNNPQLAHTKIVLGGPDVTYNIENYLNSGADYIAVGEGEETLHELTLALKGEMNLADVNGLAYKEDKTIIKTEERIKIKDLDDLPMPNRKAYPLEKYLEVWKKHHGESALNVSTQRGCPYTCKWCSTAVYGQSYRRRSPEKVVEELVWIQETYNPDTIWFVDDVFTVSHKWLEAFHAEVLRVGLKIKYECITRAERMNDQVIDWLKESGCFRVWIGAESGSQKIIDAMDRRVDVNRVKEMIIKTKKAGIQAGTFIMVGYPGETIEDIKQTAHYLSDSLPDQFTITKSYPIKGTALYEEIEDQITVQPDWQTSTDREIDFERNYKPGFYKWAIRYINNEVNWARSRNNGKPNLKFKLKSMVSYTGMELFKYSGR